MLGDSNHEPASDSADPHLVEGFYENHNGRRIGVSKDKISHDAVLSAIHHLSVSPNVFDTPEPECHH